MLSLNRNAVAQPEVDTTGGRLQGSVVDGVRVFLGVPYAAPPLGELRFKPPQPPQPWAGLRKSQEPPICMQRRGGNEDCLYLNVFAPTEAADGLPVLLWIHGGAYEVGSSLGQDKAVPLLKFYMNRGQPAILVSMNYRLNVFGFLGSEALRLRDEDLSTGNYGLQDQRAAMQWVRENIEAFGGDVARVMLFGQSAGAGSVSAHLCMSRSAGLFSRALMQSGGFSPWSAREMRESEEFYQEILQVTGCADATCLLELSAEELRSAYDKVSKRAAFDASVMMGSPSIPSSPSIDGVELMAHPLDMAKAGLVQNVSMVIGSTTDEGALFFKRYLLNWRDLRSIFLETYAPISGVEAALNAMRTYLKEKHPALPGKTPEWWAAQRVLTDQFAACTSRLAVASLANWSFEVFHYVFAHSQGVAAHSSDLPFLFRALHGAEELELSGAIDDYWLGLAANNTPMGAEPSWPRAKGNSAPFMQLDVASGGGRRVMFEGFREEQCNFMLSWLEKAMRPNDGRDTQTMPV